MNENVKIQESQKNKTKIENVKPIFNAITVHKMTKFIASFVLLLAQAGALGIVIWSGWKCFSK